MTINDIFLNNELSVRAFNTCIDNQIETIYDLQAYHLNYGSFKHFRNCGKKTSSELINICIKHKNPEETTESTDYDFQSNYINNLTQVHIDSINRYIKSGFLELSVRSSNALKKHIYGEINIHGFNKHIFSKPFFNINNIKDVGDKSVPEIVFFINRLKDYITKTSNLPYENLVSDFKIKSSESSFSEKVNTLNRIQRQTINNYVSIATSNLSVRNNNAINAHVNGNLNINGLTEKIFSKKYFNILDIENVGERSLLELKDYLNKIKEFTTQIIDLEDDGKLFKLQTKFFLENEFIGREIPEDIFKNDTIFKLVGYLINKSIFFTETETAIFINTLDIYIHKEYSSIVKVADDLNLSKERVRQKREQVLEAIILKIKFLKNFDKKILFNYGIDFNRNIISLSDENVKLINYKDQTLFSKQFITLIVSTFFEEDYILIGNMEDVFIPKEVKHRQRHKWKNIYIIKKPLNQIFYFNKFIEDLHERLNAKIEETYNFNFKSYLTKFFRNDDLTFLDQIFEVGENLINQEFNIFLSLNEEISFNRNTIKNLPEYAYEALEFLGKPSHIDDINKEIKKLKPDYSKVVKNTTLKREFGFIPFGKTSVFGLQKWEKEQRNIKGGTIRRIAEEFLDGSEEPQHIKEIVEYILKFRPDSNEKSISYNLKLEENNKFVFFKNSHIGLSLKKYDPLKYIIPSRSEKILSKSWDESYNDLLIFTTSNNRLPSSISCPDHEIRLSRWLNIQRSKMRSNSLDKEKEKQLSNLLSNYNVRQDKTTLFRHERYKKLNEFIEIHHRLPSANKSQESQLYGFFYKQRKLYEESNLSEEEEKTFLAIAKLIQNLKA